MIKGCQKKVIWVRDTGSTLYEEAYFVLSDRAEGKTFRETDMVNEAHRIISQSPVANYWDDDTPRPKASPKIKITKKIAWFLSGTLLSSAVFTLITLIF